MIKDLRFKIFGFTLIELLVVISIIGILIALGAVSFITSMRNARDSRRLGDVKNIMTALERYYNDNRSYPLGDGSCTTSETWCCSTSGGGKSSWIPGLSSYMDNGVPNQLGNLQGHCYNDSAGTSNTSQRYFLHYTLERRTDTAPGRQFDGPGVNNSTYPRYEIRGGD